jgi:predicted TIM-barrel fold metal-dependent hydrolase
MPNERARVIDVHNHWMPAELLANVERCLPQEYRCERGDDGRIKIIDGYGMNAQTIDSVAYGDVTMRLANMDTAGIDIVLLTAGCYPSWITLEAARIFNDAGADLMRKHGGRLRPMAHVPPFGEDGIIDELVRAAKLGLPGVGITTNYHGKYPDEAEYLPFFRKAAELGMPVFIHAAGGPVHAEDLHRYNLTRSLGRALDHTLVVVRMLYSGVLADIPDLRLVFNHLGGTFFATAKRYLDVPPDMAVPPGGFRKLLERTLFDTAPAFWWSPTEIACAVGALGAERVVLGTDYPAHPMRGDPAVLLAALDNIRKAGLRPEEQRLIEGGNAERFYNLH